MKIKLSVLYLLIFLFLASCKEHQNVKAKIFERKEIRGDKLMIKYNYVANGQLYIDSATIHNRVIPGDSIIVTIDPSNPRKGSPKF